MGETTEARQPVEVYRSRSSYPCKYLFTAEVRVIRPRSKAIIRHRVGVTKYIKTNKIRPKPPTLKLSNNLHNNYKTLLIVNDVFQCHWHVLILLNLLSVVRINLSYVDS